jgi:hypothetical protein
VAIYGREAHPTYQKPSYETIIRVVAHWAGLDPHDLSARRTLPAIRASHVALCLAAELRREPASTTAAALGMSGANLTYARRKVAQLVSAGALDCDQLRQQVHDVELGASLPAKRLRSTFDEVLAAVGMHAKLTREQILTSQLPRAVRARHVSLYLVNAINGETPAVTARTFKVSSDTVTYARSRIVQAPSDSEIKRDVEAVQVLLESATIEVPLVAFMREPPSVEVIVAVVADLAQTTSADIFAPKGQEAREARRMAIYLCNAMRSELSKETARAFGAEYATVLSTRTEMALKAEDPAFAAVIKQIEKRIRLVADGSPSLGPALRGEVDPGTIAARIGAVNREAPPIRWGARSKPGHDVVIEAVAESLGIEPEAVRYQQTLEARRARHLAIYLTNTLRHEPLAETARTFGVDHTTVLYAREKMLEESKQPNVAEKIATLGQVIADRASGLARPPVPTMPSQQRNVSDLFTEQTLAAAEFHGTSIERILSRSREPVDVAARYLAIYLCRRKSDVVQPVIGEFFERDRTVVVEATEHIERKLRDDANFKAVVDQLLSSHPFTRNREEATIARAPATQVGRASQAVPIVNRRPLANLQSLTTPIRIGGKKLSLGSALHSSDHGDRLTSALRDIFLVDALTEIDARRLGLAAPRREAIARSTNDSTYRKLIFGLRTAIEPNRKAVFAALDQMIALERTRQIEPATISL